MASSPLLLTVKESFRQNGWQFDEIETDVVAAAFEAHHTRVQLHVQVFPAMNLVSVVSESHLTTDDPLRRDRLAELAMRVNCTLNIGAFELQWDQGRLIFRITNLFPDPGGDIGIIAGLIHNTVVEMDRISPAEVLIHRSSGAELAGIDIAGLLEREDLLPGTDPD